MPVCRYCCKSDCHEDIDTMPVERLSKFKQTGCLLEFAMKYPRRFDIFLLILEHIAKMGKVKEVESLLAVIPDGMMLPFSFLDKIVLHSCRSEYYSDLPRLAAIIGLFRKAGYTVSADTMGCLEARINWLIKQAGADLTKANRYLTEAKTNLAKAEAEADLTEAKADLAEAEIYLASFESSLSSLMAKKTLIMTA